MPTIGGLWVFCVDLSDRVEAALESEAATVPIFLPTARLAADASALALISLTPDTVDYLSVATAGRRGSSLERKVAFGPACRLAEPIDIRALLDDVPIALRRHIKVPTHRAEGVPPKTWNALLTAVVTRGRVDDTVLAHLNAIVASRAKKDSKEVDEIVNYERDATAVSLETFRGSAVRQRYLSASPFDKQAPFIHSLEASGAVVLEDRMIEHDLSTFPGGSALRRHVVGGVTVHTDTGSLTIVNANRTGIEKTLGVDLVYYHHGYDSFTMVQYKRLTGDKEPVYRPSSDSSYEAELARMKAFCGAMSAEAPEDVSAYRLSKNPFFFKFCASQQDIHWSRMLSGMYLPLDLLERFLASGQAVGPRGGIVVGYDNTNRRMSNSQFVQLLRGGWVGSVGIDSEKISAILEQELAADKSIIAAIHRERASGEDYLRDTKGRFASEDDPEAI